MSKSPLLESDRRHVVHSLHHGPTCDNAHIWTGGRGAMLFDEQGREFYDALAGLWNVVVGHGRSELASAASRQMSTLAYATCYAGSTNRPAIELAERLAGIFYPSVNRFFFTCGGAEANEAAFKTARFFWKVAGKNEKTKIIGRNWGYHGTTLAAMSATGLPAYWPWFEPRVPGFLHIESPYPYRFVPPITAADDPRTPGQLAADLLEEAILREGPDTVAAFLGEPVQCVAGVIVPQDDYWPRIRAICDRYDVLLIADEVITGFGRTGNWWGSQTVGMTPRTISAAKQLTAAYAPLGAVMVPEDVYQAYVDHSAQLGTFGHGFTYGGHPLGCALGVKAIEIYERRNIVGHVRSLMPTFERRIRAMAEHPLIGEARFCGLVGAVELVADKKTKRSFDAKKGVGPQAAKLIEKNGAVLRAIGDTIAICPPMIITEAELNELFDRFEKGLDEAEAWVAKEELRAI